MVGLFSINSIALADEFIQIGCKRLSLVLAPSLSPGVIDREWASGAPRTEAAAVLELRGCKGQLLDQLSLDAPFARLDHIPLRGTPAPSYLVTVDLTDAAGSYNGPLTFPVQRVNKHLQRVVVLADDGRFEPIHLPLTGKAAWKKISRKGIDELLVVSCQPQGNTFVTYYCRYYPFCDGWRVHTRSSPGLWESDGASPETRFFP